MPLSSELISEFVSVTSEQVDIKPTESTVYGTIVVYDEVKYVQLDGSDILTPIESTTESNDGDRVMVLIKNHTATVTGNVSDKSAGSGRVDSIFDTLEATDAEIKNLKANYATIALLEADYASIETLKANYATIALLEADYASIETLKANYATIDNLKVVTGEFGTLNAEFGNFKNVTADNFSSVNADIKNLNAKIVTTDTLNASYANIDFANVSDATIDTLTSKLAIIQNGTFENGTFTGELVAVTINGDLINAGTLKADRLIVRGEDGIYYQLNVDKNGAKPEGISDEDLQNALHGSKIIANSITADKISVSDLVAFGAKIGGFVLVDGKLYSGVKESASNTTTGIYLGSDGQMAVGDSKNYVKFYKDGDEYKLDISADNIQLNTGRSLNDVAEDNADLNLRMGNAETSIAQNADAIKSSATKSEVSALGARVSEAESTITQTANELSAKLSSDDYYGVRQFDTTFAQSDCYERQGIQVVGNIEFTQAGSSDPTPDNIRAIFGKSTAKIWHCGKNLLDVYSLSGTNDTVQITHSYINDRVRVLYTSANDTGSGLYAGANSAEIMLKAGVTYTLSVKISSIESGEVRFGLKKPGGSYAYQIKYNGSGVLPVGEHSISFTPSEDMLVQLTILVTYDKKIDGNATFDNIQLEVGSSKTEYESYIGSSHECDFEQTVYAGSMTVNSGVLNITHKLVELTGNEEVRAVTGGDGLTYYVIESIIPDDIVSGTNDIISSHYVTTGGVYRGDQGVRLQDSLKSLMLRDSRFQNTPNVVGLKAYFADQKSNGTPIQICYKLAEPTTIQLSPYDIAAIDGLNTIYSDFTSGVIEFGHETLNGLGGASRHEMTTELNLKAGSAELVVTSNRITDAESRITQLAESISTLVQGENGSSLMTQTEDGWVFNIANVLNTLDDAMSELGGLTSEVDDVNGRLDGMGDTVSELSKTKEYVKIDVDENDHPRIILGEEDSDFKVEITNVDIRFKEGSLVPASISNQALNIDNAVVDNELRQGGFAWIARPNGNYGLVWKGE